MMNLFETIDYVPYEVAFIFFTIIFIAISLPRKYDKR